MPERGKDAMQGFFKVPYYLIREQGIVNLAIELNNMIESFHENKEHRPQLQGLPLPA
jgi:hypothetical protein